MSTRYRVLGLIWLLQFVNYLDRVNISVAGPSMMKALSIDTASFGFVLAAFTVGYAVMQLPGGILADRFGAKVVLMCAPLLWSLFTGLTGLIESTAALIAVRFCSDLPKVHRTRRATSWSATISHRVNALQQIAYGSRRLHWAPH
jgi:MFS transporter, ACS family, D-galactonate transporter